MEMSRGSVFIPITLTCTLDENIWRLLCSQRQTVSQNKLTDENLVQSIRARGTLREFSLPTALAIDVTEKSPGKVAQEIAGHICRVCKDGPTKIIGAG
jgi:hypothetical protein